MERFVGLSAVILLQLGYSSALILAASDDPGVCCPEETEITVIYNGYIYRTLTGLRKRSTGWVCESTFTTPPAGFSILNFDQEVYNNVVYNYPWGTHAMTFGSSGTWHTGNNWKGGPRYDWKVSTSGAQYKASACHLAVLIRKELPKDCIICTTTATMSSITTKTSITTTGTTASTTSTITTSTTITSSSNTNTTTSITASTTSISVTSLTSDTLTVTATSETPTITSRSNTNTATSITASTTSISVTSLTSNTITVTATSTSTIPASHIAVFSGTVKLNVADPQAFINDTNAAAAFDQYMSQHLGVALSNIVTIFRDLTAGNAAANFHADTAANLAADVQVLLPRTQSKTKSDIRPKFNNLAGPVAEFADHTAKLIEVTDITESTVMVTTTTTAALPSAEGDPHCVNLKGEHFDIYGTGKKTLLKVPNSPSTDNVTLEIHAFITHAAHTKCAQTFIKSVYITGLLAPGGIDINTGPTGSPRTAEKRDANVFTLLKNDTLSIYLGNVTVNLRQRHGIIWNFDYIDINVTGLRNSFQNDIGGPLGYGQHTYLSQPTDECKTWARNHNNSKTLYSTKTLMTAGNHLLSTLAVS